MKIAIYHRSVPNQKNQEKVDLLTRFSQGARKCGDECIDVQDHTYHSADVGMIQGWVTDDHAGRLHLRLRNDVISQQLLHRRYVLTADSNLFLYANTDNPHHYLRFSANSVFPDTGIYFDRTPDPSRWRKISQDLNIHLKDYRRSGGHILLLLQRNGGWSMGKFSVLDWLASTILDIRNHTDRPILIRPHPGDKKARDYIGNFDSSGVLKKVRISEPGRTLLQDLEGCWAAINHNSSPVVGAAIEGIPIFVTDPRRSQCSEIANTSLGRIENPEMPDRQKWVERLAMSHWNFVELSTGAAWSHMRSFIT